MGPRSGGDDAVEDDFTLEVTDLRGGRVLDTSVPVRFDTERSWGDEDDELTVAPLNSDTSDTTGASSASRRRPHLIASTRVRSVLIIVLALVTCLAVLSQLSGAGAGLKALLQATTPTSAGPVGIGESTFYFLEGAQWGRLTVDGETINLPPEPTPVTLDVGRHVLQYQAAPFPTLLCELTVPADAKHDTCPLITNIPFGDGPDGTRVISLGCTPDRLPADAYDRLLRAVSTAFATTPTYGTVDPGDHYLGADGAAAVASAPLRAAVGLELNLDPSRRGAAGDSSCLTFCADAFMYGNAASAWGFEAHVLARWSFSTRDGRYVPSSGATVDTLIYLTAEWVDDGWVLDPAGYGTPGNFCYDALVGPPGALSPFVTGSVSSVFAEASDPTDGCVVAVSPSGDINSFTVGLPDDAALFIYHFGVVLAGNELAHQELPQLAVATDRECLVALRWYDSLS